MLKITNIFMLYDYYSISYNICVSNSFAFATDSGLVASIPYFEAAGTTTLKPAFKSLGFHILPEFSRYIYTQNALLP